jgi:serine/threonine-protein kinase
MERHPSERLVGKVFAGFRIIQRLGSGGTGDVFLSERVDEGPRAPRYALKVVRDEIDVDEALVARFEREATAAVRIRHENVLEITHVELIEGRLACFAMEVLVGLDLADTLAFARALAPTRAVRIATGAAAGLAAAHDAAVVHRDVKPENLFLVHAADGRELVKVLDFGFAHLPSDPPLRDAATGALLVVGTPEYMAPEQAAGAAAAPSADIYSLGVVLFEMLTGRTPYVGAYPAIVELHAQAPIPALRDFDPSLPVSPELESILALALAKRPEDRFQSMHAFHAALAAIPESTRIGRGP